MKRVIFFAVVIFWFSCEPRQGQQVGEAPPKAAGIHEIVAKEVIQANSYTYVKAEEDGNEVWLAILKTEVEVDKTYYYEQAMEMKNFKSKDLDRTFETILFLGAISDTPVVKKTAEMTMPNDDAHKKQEDIPRSEMNIDHEEGETAIGYLYENKESLANKKVIVKGIVTKFNPDIMNRNWVHIQDGTGGEATFDLTITTNDNIKVGSIASFEGTVAINKDFGAGYKYDLILEEAVLLNKKLEVKVN